MTVGDWDRRQLCSDGACIGVIGSDGLCKVCGRAAQGWGDERKRGLVADAAGDDDDDLEDDEEYEDDEDGDEYEDDDEGDNVDPISPSAPAALGALAEWHERRLCVDGACIGLLGDDGRCKVCGTVGSKAKPGRVIEKATVADAELEAAAQEMAQVAASGEVDALPPAAGADDDLEARKLCPDGGCVGVIGADGHCKVCGKEAA
jgi:hypothetical protein